MQRFVRSFHAPDERQTQELASLEVVELGDLTIGRSVTRPGFRWSLHIRPVVGGDGASPTCGHRPRGSVRLHVRERLDAGTRPPRSLRHPAGARRLHPRRRRLRRGRVGRCAATTGFSGSLGNRALVALLFTDLVGSTERATQLGDQAWRDLLSQHYESIRRELDHLGGREIDTTGDGMLTTFESPAAALQVRPRSSGAQARWISRCGPRSTWVRWSSSARACVVWPSTSGTRDGGRRPNEILVAEPVRAFARRAAGCSRTVVCMSSRDWKANASSSPSCVLTASNRDRERDARRASRHRDRRLSAGRRSRRSCTGRRR